MADASLYRTAMSAREETASERGTDASIYGNISGRADVQVCEGETLSNVVPAKVKSVASSGINVKFEGTNGDKHADSFVMNEDMLSHHLLVVGGIGSGKTNTMNLALREITRQMTSQDVMIIFDTKGDFKDKFYRPGDVIISNDATACGPRGEDHWNLLNELAYDERLPENIMEITNALYAEKLKKTKDSFFPTAAKELTGALIHHAVTLKEKKGLSVNNYFLAQCFRNDQEWFLKMLDQYPEYRSLKSYIPESAPNQAMGVMAEMNQVMRQILIGNFAKRGNLSIRELVRQKGGRRIFIEYDIGVGSMLTPIYSLLFDLAIKEALCREKSAGNVYMIADEFKLLPNLQHIDDAVNFGRSLGLKFIVGMQNVDQIIDIYGEHRAKNIFSGFMSHFAFRVADYNTRNYIKERAGQNRKRTSGTFAQESFESAHVVEDWDIAGMTEKGQAIIMLNGHPPFRFRFAEYKES